MTHLHLLGNGRIGQRPTIRHPVLLEIKDDTHGKERQDTESNDKFADIHGEQQKLIRHFHAFQIHFSKIKHPPSKRKQILPAARLVVFAYVCSRSQHTLAPWRCCNEETKDRSPAAMKNRLVSHTLLAVLAAASALATQPAQADGPRGRGGPGGYSGPRMHSPGPSNSHHGYHDGRWGLWWLAGATWMFYPQPVYPYPQVVVQPAPVEPVIVQPAPQTTAQNWYYCDSAKAYYPYVQACAEGWRAVPATPPASGQNPAPAAAQNNWYYCDSAKTYYPYVQSCAEGWRATPANPPGGTPNTEGGRQP
jgi:hypothetical protein